MVDFKKEISFGSKSRSKVGKKSGSYPTKTRINLVSTRAHKENRTLTIALFVVFIILLGLFAQFAIIDPLASAGASSKRVEAAQQQLDDLKKKNSELSDLSDQYDRFVVSGMTNVERELVSRNEVIDLLRSRIMGAGTLSSVKISGNMLTVTCQGLSLQDASGVVRNLEQDERVSHVTVSTAQERDGSAASATLEITLKNASELAEVRREQQSTSVPSGGSAGEQNSTVGGGDDGE